MKSKELEKILQPIRQKKFEKSIYFLCGEESYFIDKIADTIENHALTESEKSFNQEILYGTDVTAKRLISIARSYPVMAERKVIILKEADRMKKEEFESLESLIEKPIASTLLVIIYKKKKPDMRLKINKLLSTNSVFIECKPVYENQISDWIAEFIHEKGYQMDAESIDIVAQHLGTNLQVIENELSKIFLMMAGSGQKRISRDLVYETINIDRDYNVFQLMEFVAKRDHFQCQLIIDQMLKNVKDNPSIVIVSQLFKYFTTLSWLRQQNIVSDALIQEKTGTKYPAYQKFKTGVGNFQLLKIKQNMLHLFEADLSLKGVGGSRMSEAHIMKTLIYKILS